MPEKLTFNDYAAWNTWFNRWVRSLGGGKRGAD